MGVCLMIRPTVWAELMEAGQVGKLHEHSGTSNISVQTKNQSE